MALDEATRRAGVYLLAERTAAVATRALDVAGIPHVHLKGFAAARLLYESVSDRPVGDVDVFVPWPKLARARRALESVGFASGPGLSTTHAIVFVRGATFGPHLDVQGWVGYPLAIRGGLLALIERGARAETTSGPVSLPDALDVACLSALFAVRDRLRSSTVTLVADVLRGVHRAGEPAMLARARLLGCERAVSMVLALAKETPDVRVDGLRAADCRWPRVLSAAPTLLLDQPIRAAISFAATSVVLGAEHAARRLGWLGPAS